MPIIDNPIPDVLIQLKRIVKLKGLEAIKRNGDDVVFSGSICN